MILIFLKIFKNIIITNHFINDNYYTNLVKYLFMIYINHYKLIKIIDIIKNV